MRIFYYAIIVGFLIAFQPQESVADNYDALYLDLDESKLSVADKRFLQAALAFEGHYNGLLDGAWGNLSRKALRNYSREEFGTPSESWHMVILALSLFDRIKQNGWDIEYFDRLGVSLLFPTDAFHLDENTKHFVNWRHVNSSVSYSIGQNSLSATRGLHDYTLGWHERSEDPYTVRKQNFAVTAAEKWDGSTLYTRSDFVNGGWTTVMLSSNSRDTAILNAIAASIQVGPSSALMFTENGYLHRTVEQALALADEEQAEATSESSKHKPEGVSGSGTGFVVSGTGHVLTNAHVVRTCSSIMIDEKPAKLVDSSKNFDLALLKADRVSKTDVASFSNGPAKLNSDVTVVGYPYAGLLGGVNVTRGSVSSLKGIGGKSTQFQITAPVQSGNSGGPILASDGAVVGVVVSKLDAVKVAGKLGDVPQNVNFGVRGEIAKLYLSQNGVDPLLVEVSEKMEPEELAQEAAKFTVFIECR